MTSTQAFAVDRRLTVRTVLAKQAPKDWDDWILEASKAEARFCQTTHWLTIEREVNGAEGYVVWVESGSERLGAAAVSIRSPRRVQSVRDVVRCFVPGRRSRELLCAEGPVLPGSPQMRTLAGPLLLREVARLGRQCAVDVIRMTPSWDLRTVDGACRADSSGSSRWSDYVWTDWATALVDLTCDEAELGRRLRQAARKAVRKAREAGIRIEQCSTYAEFEREFRPAYNESVLIETGERRAPREDRRWWECDGGRHYRFFLAKDASGRIHATLGTYSFGGVAKEIMSGRTRAGRESGLPAQDLLHFELFLVHKQLGDTRFDLAGYNPSPRNTKEDGIRRFKQKWGGEQVVTSVFTKRLHARLLPRVLSSHAVFGR